MIEPNKNDSSKNLNTIEVSSENSFDMKYKTLSLWIFVLLMLTVLLMVAIPTQTMVVLGMILAPVFVLVQVYGTLKAQSPDNVTSSEQWYEY